MFLPCFEPLIKILREAKQKELGVFEKVFKEFDR